jgi:DNA polymerase-1
VLTLGERAEQALRVVEEAPEIAYDTETSGVNWKIHNPVGYVITTDDFNVYVPIRHGGGGNLLGGDTPPLLTPTDKIVIHPFERALAKAFIRRREKGLLTVGHHLKFDMHFSANAEIMIGRECGDTQINMAMLNEYSRSFSLATAATTEKVTAKKGEELYEHMSRVLGIPLTARPADIMEHYWRLSGDDPVAVDYAMGDGTTTLEVWRSQIKAIEEEGMSQIHRIESRLVWTLFRMERRGIKVDEKYIGSLAKAVEKEVEQALKRLPPNFNVRSPTAMRLLFEDLGITNWPVTALGNPSFTEKFLKQSQPGKDVIAVRQLRNLKASFVDPLKDVHMWKGRVHTNINQLKADEFGTVGGRISTNDPNLLAVPKRNKEIGPRFRRCFVADEGMDYWEADYKQAEPVLFAHYSQDEALLAGYNSDPIVDCHSSLAVRMGVERDPTAKRMNMGIFTGMQPKTFAMHMGWDLERATNAWNEWFEIFPGVRNFQDRAKRAFQSRGYVVTLLGRRCHLEHPRFAYRGTSRIIQGGNADIMKAKILEVDEWLESLGDPAHLLLSIYDSLEWQAPKGAAGEKLSLQIVEMCTNLQVAPFNLRCPLGMDVGHGPSWAHATYGDEIMKQAA